jgi:hypothetical protein
MPLSTAATAAQRCCFNCHPGSLVSAWVLHLWLLDGQGEWVVRCVVGCVSCRWHEPQRVRLLLRVAAPATSKKNCV